MKVLLLGDSHGDKAFVKDALDVASSFGLNAVVQLGDFGFWPRTNNGQKFLHDVGKHASEVGVSLFFIDGNHEDHTALEALDHRDLLPGCSTWFVPWGKYPICYILRGSTWSWGNMRFGAFGGAYSIDRKHRIEDDRNYGWFQREMPDASRIPQLHNLDVILTHDAPIVPPVMQGQAYKEDVTSTLSQHLVRCALNASGASLLVHGHWHLNERYEVDGATIQGLDCNGSPLQYSAVILDTIQKRLYTMNEWMYKDE